jgi:hypothetical protein
MSQASRLAPDLHAGVIEYSGPVRCNLCARQIPSGSPVVVVSRQPLATMQRGQTWHPGCAQHLRAVLEEVLGEAGYMGLDAAVSLRVR